MDDDFDRSALAACLCHWIECLNEYSWQILVAHWMSTQN